MRTSELTPQQKAAKVVYQLALRALAGLDGLTTQQIACLVELTPRGALFLMQNISGPGIPICVIDGKWTLAAHHLKAACQFN